MDTNSAIAALEDTQLGLFTLAQAVAAGLSRNTPRRKVQRREWVEWEPNVFSRGRLDATLDRRSLAACRSAGPLWVASHETAASLHGLAVRGSPRRVEILGPRGATAKLWHARAHSSETFCDEDSTMVGPVPVTTVERTVCDLAAVLRRRLLEQLVLDAIRKDLTDAAAIRACLRRLGPAAGCVALRDILERVHPEAGRLESVVEIDFLQLVDEGRLPRPRLNYVVRDEHGWLLARVDFAYPELRIAIEVDGFRFHATRAEKEYDDRRQNALVAAGWIVLRFSAGDFVGSARAATIQRLRDVLARAA